jgi:hypothetical protein
MARRSTAPLSLLLSRVSCCCRLITLAVLEPREDRDKFAIDEGEAPIPVRRLGSDGNALKCDPRGPIRRSAPQK